MTGVNFCLFFVIVAFLPPIVSFELIKDANGRAYADRDALAVVLLVIWSLAMTMMLIGMAWWLVSWMWVG